MARKKTQDRTDPRKLSVEAKQYTAYRLRMAGATLQQIADFLGYKSCSGAQKAIEAGQRKLHYEPALDARKLAKDRLEGLLNAVWDDATKGALGAQDRAIKVLDQLNKIEGVYEAQKVDLTSGGKPIFVTSIEHVPPDADDETD
jgi:hypothetical protein